MVIFAPIEAEPEVHLLVEAVLGQDAPLRHLFLRQLGAVDDLELLALRHQRACIVKVYSEHVLDTKGVTHRADVLERGRGPVFRDAEREVPQILPCRHLHASEFEQAAIFFKYHDASQVLVFFLNQRVLVHKILRTALAIAD